MTLFSLFQKKVKYQPDDPAISWSDGQRIINLSNKELWLEFAKVVSYLKSLNIKPGQRVGLLANTSGYWHLADISIMALGATTVPIYPTASDDEITFIINDCKMSAIITDDFDKTKSLSHAGKAPMIIPIYEPDHQNYFLKYKHEVYSEESELAEEIRGSLGKHPASIIYTSGTTATPKGVVTEHSSIDAVLAGIAKRMKGKVSKGNVSLTSLPLSHVLGRCDSFLHFCLPIQTYFGESPKTFMNDLRTARPSYIITVPRIIEKIKERIETQVAKKSSFSQKLYSINYSIANEYFHKIDAGLSPTRLETQLFIKGQKYFFSKVRSQISTELKFLVSGGAKLGPETYNFFRNIGIPILEGYGLTETFGPAFLNSQFNGPPGFVGHPLPGVKMKFAKDGEILLKGESVFKSYNELSDTSCFDKDNYFRTGDIGEWSISNGLKITDRKKDIIVTSGGKNVAPAKIESLMNECPHISQFMLVGDSRKYLTGLVVIAKESFFDLIDSGVIPPGINHDDLSQQPEIIELVESEIQLVNSKLASYEKVKQFYIIPVSVTPGSIYLSSSLKLKKDKLFNKYMKEINAMY
jgi:long-chain acyl-CoA synthetase